MVLILVLMLMLTEPGIVFVLILPGSVVVLNTVSYEVTNVVKGKQTVPVVLMTVIGNDWVVVISSVMYVVLYTVI